MAKEKKKRVLMTDTQKNLRFGFQPKATNGGEAVREGYQPQASSDSQDSSPPVMDSNVSPSPQASSDDKK